MINPFAEYANLYLKNKFSPIPIRYGQKQPAITNWTKYAKTYLSADDITQWSNAQHNIGICTGQLSGVIGLDLDADYDNTHAKLLSIVPDSPVKKRGNKGFTAFYKYNGEHSRTLSVKGHQIGDLLSEGRQCVIPPSLHPNGQQYEWHGPSLLDIPKFALPVITEDMWTQINNLLRPVHKSQNLTNRTIKYDFDTPDIQDALDCIPPDCDYDAWCRIGMALHTHFNGALVGLELFDRWSAGGCKYKHNEPAHKWASFTADNGIGIGTLFYIAQEYGFSKSLSLLSRDDEIIINKFLRG